MLNRRGVRGSLGLPLPMLPQIPTPETAVAIAMQAQASVGLQGPRGMNPAPLGQDRSMLVPSSGSAMYMMPFWHGFMCANSVGFVREAVEVVPMLHSDSAELADAVCLIRNSTFCLRYGERSLRFVQRR